MTNQNEPKLKSDKVNGISPSFRSLWLQASLEDHVAELFYIPLLLTIPATVLCYFNLIPFPWDLAASISGVFAMLLILRMARNWLFILRSNVVSGQIGAAGSSFRRWQQFDVLFKMQGRAYCVPYAFTRGKVTEGDTVLLFSHRNAPTRILILERVGDKHSLLR